MDSPAQSSTQTALIIKRCFNAPIDRVFEAWTNADVLANWFGPVGFTVTTAKIDLIVGGKYLIVLQPPEGEAIKHFGEYLEINQPDKLVFTWILENQPCNGSKNQCGETLVSIDFKQNRQMTEIVLKHEHLPDKEAYDGHAFGWNSALDSFDTFLLNNE